MAVLCGFVPLLRAAESDVRPSSLLTTAFELAQKRPDKGDAPTTAFLRLGATMRMAGMKDKALAALERGIAMADKASDESTRDETRVELCRELTLLDKPDRARELVSQIRARQYDLVAWLFIAQAALEKGDAAEAERTIRDVLRQIESSRRKLDRMGSAALCALSRLAESMKKPELARQCVSLASDPMWKSGMLGDEAEALAEKGQTNEALRVVAQAEDPHMAVLAHARVGAVIFRKKQSSADSLPAILQTAAKIKSSDARDFALRMATKQLASAGDAETALKIAAEIKHPVMRLLAAMPLVNAASFDGMLAGLRKCADDERPLLAEVLTIACGGRGLAEHALVASAQTAPGWPRVRALTDAAQHAKGSDATKLVVGAERELTRITDAGWRCHALVRLALAAHRAGNSAATDRHLAAACDEALRLDSPDALRNVIPQVVEAALLTQHKDLALKTLTEALKRQPETALRDALAPMLIDAGDADAALAECSKKQLMDDFSRRFIAYRLAKTGRLADAVKYASGLNLRDRAEALADIALAQLPPPAPAVRKKKVAGVSVHGGWMYWMARLERMALAWEIVPFNTPYAAGAEGLAAKYWMLGYPGTGSHHMHVSAAGKEHLRDYLRGGGGLFGICAGQFLASGPPGHRFTPTDCYYLRGEGPHQVQLPRTHPMNLLLPEQMIISRKNGGFLLPRAGCDVVAWYDRQDMCAAVVAAHYGWGRVVLSSPHPEGSSDFEPNDRLCIAATLWILEEMP